MPVDIGNQLPKTSIDTNFQRNSDKQKNGAERQTLSISQGNQYKSEQKSIGQFTLSPAAGNKIPSTKTAEVDKNQQQATEPEHHSHPLQSASRSPCPDSEKIPACDYIVIGAGSAGCVMANRLTASGKYQLTLLEAGPDDNSAMVRIPGAMPCFIYSHKYNWRYESVSKADIRQGETMNCPRGKTLGGSSAINAMIYIRGQASDYDHWEKLGNTGWNFQNMLPYFKKAESNSRFTDEYHGQDGPLYVSDADGEYPLNQCFLNAAEESGEVYNGDFNGETQEGCGNYQVTIKDGRRWSSATAYLDPAKSRKNLDIQCNASVRRIMFNDKQAIGVEYCQRGQTKKLIANREVLLCAGTFNSPQILMLSGVGDKDELAKHEIPLQHHLPGVGKNLQEHVDAGVLVASRKNDGITLKPQGLWNMAPDVYRYFRSGTGKLASPVCQVGGFFKSSPEVAKPDVQMHFIPGLLDGYGKNMRLLFSSGYSLRVCVLRPKSRGTVSLDSSDPQVPPKIDFNFLDHEDDQKALVNGVKLARKFLAQKAFDEHRGEELHPKKDVVSDEGLLKASKDRLGLVFHPVGTCKMGTDDMAVVDNKLRVHGISNLRVIDGSIMPEIVSGNTNAPIIAIAEKIADEMLKADGGE